MPRPTVNDLSIDGPVPLADELAALFPREQRQPDDVDTDQMADRWQVTPRAALTRLHALARAGKLIELQVVNTVTRKLITVWRKP